MLDITFRVQIRHRPGMLARIAGAIGDREGLIGDVTTEKLAREATVREITVEVRDDDHATAIAETLNGLDGVEVLWQRDLGYPGIFRGALLAEAAERSGAARPDMAPPGL